MTNKLNRFSIAAFTAFLFISAVSISAQSNIFSMPSTDIQGKDSVSVSLITKFKTNDESAKKRFSAFTPKVVAGVMKNVEVGVSIGGNVQPGKDATSLVTSVKWKFYENEKYGVAMAAGNNFYVPLRNKKYDFGTYTYVAVSKTIKTTKTRLTMGSYLYSKNVVASKATRAGGQFGIEQPINKRFAFAAEYVTGKHSGGYFLPGMKVKWNKRMATKFGYTIHNSKVAQGNHYFYVSTGINFKY